MGRRNAVRRKQLDDGQHQEAMKVLKKYVDRKYRGSMLISQQDLLEGQPEMFRPPSMRESRVFDRQSTTYSFFPPNNDIQSPRSPKVMSLDLFDEPKVLEEMKFDSRTDTIFTYPIRVVKAAVQLQATKQMICLLLIASIGLIGGAMFQYLERPNQLEEMYKEGNTTVRRHKHFSLEILLHLSKNECIYKMHNSAAKQLSHSSSLCQHSLTDLLARYDQVYRKDYGITPPWEWDYWNSVFFAGTVFTTIGYGILAPKTALGRIAFMIYAIISIPTLLGVMKVFGDPILQSFRDNYGFLKKKMGRIYRRIRPSYKKTPTLEDGTVDEENLPFSLGEEDEEEVDHFEKVPWQIAIIILVGFLVMCSWMFTLWEDWTFFESFYFTFTSLTTIGFGDVVPQYPRFALILFVFYICGLFVVSSVYAYMQSKIEEKYFWALQLVDMSGSPQDIDQPTKMEEMNGVRWRSTMDEGGLNGGLSFDGGLETSGRLTRQSTLLMKAPSSGGQTIIAPPSVSALYRTMSMKRNSLARSESMISKSSFGSKWRPFSNSPSASEHLSPTENKKTWLNVEPQPSYFQFSPKPFTSAPSLVPPRNPTGGGGLSVITEVNDEDTLNTRGSQKTRQNPELLLPEIGQQQASEIEPVGTSIGMIDDEEEVSDEEDVFVQADDEGESEEGSRALSTVLIPHQSPRSLRILHRASAQDLESPVSEVQPDLSPRLPQLIKEEDEPDIQVTEL